MRNCKNCKHWGDVSEEPSYRRCDHPKVHSPLAVPDGFSVQDGEPGNAGAIATGPQFGCIHWEDMFSPECRECKCHSVLKRGWTGALYCSEHCERVAVDRLHNSMPGAGPGGMPLHVSLEISRRWKE